ncbi:hypothetical protein D4R86_00645 [bacterium]|nr:MAG: hypothetical protein D4R86_00645 [bacterium]
MEFKRLGEVINQETDVLTLRTTNAYLRSDELQSNEIVIRIDQDPEVLTSSKERREHGQNSDSAWFEKQLEIWKEAQENHVIVATPDHPLEVITCDVCPILLIDGKRYIASFLRDIWPVGWLIPGGCPSSFRELLIPRRVAFRELQEELIILDNKNVAYSFGASEETLLKILKSYRITPKSIIRTRIQDIPPFPGHAGNLRIMEREKEMLSIGNINATIDPYTASVAITLYCEIEIPVPLSELRLFDGEFIGHSDTLVNRAVRLTKKIAIPEVGEKDEVVAIFVSGNNVLSTKWISPAIASRAIDPSHSFG